MNNSLSPSLGPEHGKALRNGERETKIDLNKVIRYSTKDSVSVKM